MEICTQKNDIKLTLTNYQGIASMNTIILLFAIIV
jgi:hypothetical protein